MNDILKAFDAWPEDIAKARKAKGLAKWSRLEYMAGKLKGKKSSDISYTCSHPSHNGAKIKHSLGSKEGNLHFLMGYVSPGFHMMPYHWQVIDPNLTEEQAEELFEAKGHPSNPDLWIEAELELEYEGEEELGQAHASVENSKEGAEAQEGSIKAYSNTGTYTCVPVDQKVYGQHNGQVYDWDMVRDSFFAATNPDVVEAMDMQKSLDRYEGFLTAVKDFEVPEQVLSKCRIEEFDNDVYPLVKALFPNPGSVVPLSDACYGVVTKSTIDFYDNAGKPICVDFFDNPTEELDLLKGGDSFPSFVYEFAKHYLNVNEQLELVESFVKSTPTEVGEDLIDAVVYED